MPHIKQLLCLSSLPWSEKMTRKQMIMSRMQDVKVVFVNPPAGIRSAFVPRSEVYSPYRHIRVYQPVGISELGSGTGSNGMMKGHFAMLSFIESVMKKEDLYEPTLWVYSPFYADLVDYIPHHGLIYDCAENMARSIPARRADLYYHQERQLCQKADVVFAATQSFYERVKDFNPQTYLVRNGIDYRPKMTLPDEVLDAIARLEKIAKPICGFAGVLNSHVDFEMLEKVANAGRGVVIATQTGTEDAAVADKIEKLSQNERILLVHCSKQTSVLEYISRFDVCVNPLKEADNTDEFSIRIFCEYLASGKPIITSPFPTIAKDYDDVADVAELGDTFLNMVLTAEERYDTARKTRQLEYAADCKWKARVAEIRRQLSEQQYLID